MKHLYLFLLFLICLRINGQEKALDKCFRMESVENECLIIEKHFNTSAAIPISFRNSIRGLSIDADIRFSSSKSLVRIVLEDTKGNRFLVTECYPMFFSKNEIHLIDYCEETFSLNDVVSKNIHIFISEAEVYLKNIKLTSSNRGTSFDTERYKERRKQQETSKIQRLNQYLLSNGKFWKAGETSISGLDYDAKRRIMGITDEESTFGFEYYVGGIFDYGNSLSNPLSPREVSSPYVDYFDWRHIHGINWNTLVKHQGGSGFCAAFGSVATLEAITNLYYNRKLDFDLSEEDVVNYSGGGKTRKQKYKTGMPYSLPLEYIKNNGVILDSCLAFVDDSDYVAPSVRPLSPEIIKPNSYAYIPSLNTDTIKKYIIKKGPLYGGIKKIHGLTSHAFSIVGFKRIEIGDSIVENTSNFAGDRFPITAAHTDLIGKTVWIFKNSYGTNFGHNGYAYLLVDNIGMFTPAYFKPHISSLVYDENDILCCDADGDGYYTWGIGPKPAHCPSWAPNEPDGDDSDYSKGPMDEYGFIHDINPLVSNKNWTS